MRRSPRVKPHHTKISAMQISTLQRHYKTKIVQHNTNIALLLSLDVVALSALPALHCTPDETYDIRWMRETKSLWQPHHQCSGR